MAKVFTSTIQINCRKEHTCVGCGAVYSYPFVRTITGKSGSAEQAQVLARRNVDKALAEDVDPHPCPTCGLYQPDMVADRRQGRLFLVFWLGIALLLIPLIVRFCYGMQANTATLVIASIAGALFIAYELVERSNLNRDPAANARRAAEGVASGTIHHVPGRAGTPLLTAVNPPKSIIHLLGLPMMLVGVALISSPELLRAINHWPLNSACYPPVVGPGDHTRIYMQDSISSIKGYWRGQPTVTLGNAGRLSDLNVVATTNENDWGDTIRAKDDEKKNSSTPWVELTVPEGTAGNTADCKINLEVDYPSFTGASEFQTMHSTMGRSLQLNLAPFHAGGRYTMWWWTNTLLGIVLIVIGGVILIRVAGSLRSLAIPPRVLGAPPAPAQPLAAPPPLPTRARPPRHHCRQSRRRVGHSRRLGNMLDPTIDTLGE